MGDQNTKVDSLFTNVVYQLDYSKSKILEIRNKFYWFSGIAVGVILLLSVVSHFISRNNIFWIDTATHSLFESYCGIISLIIAYVIYREYRSSGKISNFLLFLGFFSMGVFDFFHAYSNHCATLFVWFHSLSAFSGALFFLCSALSIRNNAKAPPWLRHTLVISGITAIIISAVIISKFPSPLPYAVTIGGTHHTPVNLPVVGEFSTSTIIFNILSAVFFLFSGLYFFRYFRKTNDVLYHIFSLSAFLFFESELLFAFSRLWDPSWWYWHIIKLIIFAGLVVGLTHGFTRTFNELHKSRKNLTQIINELKHAYKNLKDTQDELMESAKLASVGKLAATIAHEIRNPLGAIKNSVGIFKHHKQVMDEDKEILDIVDNEIARLNRIITDFLDFAKPSLSEKSFTNLNNLIDETLYLLFANNGDNPAIKISKYFDKELPGVFVDRDAIKQCLWNIFINSIHAMPNGGTLSVKTQRFPKDRDGRPCEDVAITIADNGTGMSEETLSNAFQPFFSTKTRGTGLGLSIAQRIINQHDGCISVSSSMGEGTLAQISIPAIYSTFAVNKKKEDDNAVHIDS